MLVSACGAAHAEPRELFGAGKRKEIWKAQEPEMSAPAVLSRNVIQHALSSAISSSCYNCLPTRTFKQILMQLVIRTDVSTGEYVLIENVFLPKLYIV